MGFTTPNIDRIGNEGGVFVNYYGQQSCTAGRAAFILGQCPFRSGLTKVGGAAVGLQKEDPTIAEFLKPLGLAWWDPKAQKLNRIELPGQSFELATASLPVKDRAAPERPATRRIGLAVAALLAIVLTTFWLMLVRYSVPPTEDSEAACFEKFEQACRTREPRATVSALLAWIDSVFPSEPTPTTDLLTRHSGDNTLAAEIASLENAAYRQGGDSANWTPDQLVQLIRAARRGLRNPAKRGNLAVGVLPPLNP